MGVLLIFYAAQGGRIGKFLVLLLRKLVIPETVLAVGLLGFFTLISIPLGLITLVLAHTVLGLGFVIPIIYARFLELDYRMTEASLVLGATSSTDLLQSDPSPDASSTHCDRVTCLYDFFRRFRPLLLLCSAAPHKLYPFLFCRCSVLEFPQL